MNHFITLFALAILSLIPTFIGKKYEKDFDEPTLVA